MIDSHAHLDSERYNEDRDAILARAFEAGVRGILSIGIGDGPATMHRAADLARDYANRLNTPKLWASAGIHPHEAQYATSEALATLDALLQRPEVIACGEIGLDYYYEHSPRDIQKSAFSRQLALAAQHKKPIILHCRPSDNSTNAWDDTLSMLESEWAPTGLGGILHCFTGELNHARRALDIGFLISFAGNITFPRNQPLRDVATQIPRDRILIETDCPFLAPVPNRGKRNEPAWVKQVAVTLANLLRTTPEEVALRTTQNFQSFFGVAAGH
ncbi:MAG: TatD family hydrolase [Acidobacteriaceae bacterium]